MNAIRKVRLAARPSLTIPTACVSLEAQPAAARIALVCRWRRDADGRLTCVWERDVPPRQPRLVIVRDVLTPAGSAAAPYDLETPQATARRASSTAHGSST